MRYLYMTKTKYLVAEDYANGGTSRVVDQMVHEQDDHTSLPSRLDTGPRGRDIIH
jgi:hypothetical protein